ncbi:MULTISPECIES: LLM class flavin-dependent oxidoreductase [unclassified Pseudonocardia]|uniref:LLM class flavin-dependent oxidoreductase n=1 Tax=unclassified Pseudonocardia TaxID=2619320 RepID=UPI0001FFE6AD|nr:LLM class flavin-dependent oxidoreductase [Pseudonocardia sp. Ae707_Ps1]OLM08937.1 Limonene 1,2-monooxygenase [Pseudonocardia sp. Ae707_Ps1]
MEQTPLEFGAFLAPWHRVDTDATIAIQQDIETAVAMDRLGYSEFWIGEHHSGGVEIVADPLLFIAAAAERTSRIKLGSGVMSLPYHHPFMLADRIVQLDHLTRGRFLFGAGPGQLVDDSRSIGLDAIDNRRKMEESFDVIDRLLAGETVTEKTDWYELDQAYLQLPPYSEEIHKAVTATVSPTGPKLAGRYGAGLLSLAATSPEGSAALKQHWGIVEELAAEHGKTVDRRNWRLTCPMHIAETEAEARENARHGLLYLMNYLAHITPGLAQVDDVDTLIDGMNSTGFGVVGTPDMAIEQIKRMQEASGGFGKLLILHGEWANFPASIRSLELIAEQVMPVFSGSKERRQRGYDQTVASDGAGAKATSAGQAEAQARFEAERAGAR